MVLEPALTISGAVTASRFPIAARYVLSSARCGSKGPRRGDRTFRGVAGGKRDEERWASAPRGIRHVERDARGRGQLSVCS